MAADAIAPYIGGDKELDIDALLGIAMKLQVRLFGWLAGWLALYKVRCVRGC